MKIDEIKTKLKNYIIVVLEKEIAKYNNSQPDDKLMYYYFVETFACLNKDGTISFRSDKQSMTTIGSFLLPNPIWYIEHNEQYLFDLFERGYGERQLSEMIFYQVLCKTEMYEKIIENISIMTYEYMTNEIMSDNRNMHKKIEKIENATKRIRTSVSDENFKKIEYFNGIKDIIPFELGEYSEELLDDFVVELKESIMQDDYYEAIKIISDELDKLKKRILKNIEKMEYLHKKFGVKIIYHYDENHGYYTTTNPLDDWDNYEMLYFNKYLSILIDIEELIDWIDDYALCKTCDREKNKLEILKNIKKVKVIIEKIFE